MLQAKQQEAACCCQHRQSCKEQDRHCGEHGLRLLDGYESGTYHQSGIRTFYHQVLFRRTFQRAFHSQLPGKKTRYPIGRRGFAGPKVRADRHCGAVNLFPTLSLTGVLGFASPQLSTLIGSNGFVRPVGLPAAGLLGPIFCGIQ